MYTDKGKSFINPYFFFSELTDRYRLEKKTYTDISFVLYYNTAISFVLYYNSSCEMRSVCTCTCTKSYLLIIVGPLSFFQYIRTCIVSNKIVLST